MTQPLLQIRNATKNFGAVRALRGVDLDLFPNEILALLGDNGAGKSTLIKCLSGVHRLDAGELNVNGQLAHLASPADARALGIETVYQDLALFDNLSTAQNFFAGREVCALPWLRRLGWLREGRMTVRAKDALARLQVNIDDFNAPLSVLSGGQRQAISVARAVSFASKVVILDEPTAALGIRESKNVIDLVRRLPDLGIAVLLISHNLEEVMNVANRAVVLRRGAVVGEAVPTRKNHSKIVSWIVGAEQAA